MLREAWAAHPDRFVSGEPKPKPLPEAVWINPSNPLPHDTGDCSLINSQECLTGVDRLRCLNVFTRRLESQVLVKKCCMIGCLVLIVRVVSYSPAANSLGGVEEEDRTMIRALILLAARMQREHPAREIGFLPVHGGLGRLSLLGVGLGCGRDVEGSLTGFQGKRRGKAY